jgi:CubicO group peptidase (beta-lactamase class C family)
MKPIALLAAALLALSAAPATAADLTAAQKAQIDKTVSQALAKTLAPSASIAVVVQGKIAYVRTYGDAQLSPEVLAKPTMRYAIGSVSKQFTAAAVLMLAEDDRLSLDEPISRWYPKVTDANRITLRQLLSHTSGIADFWPQDYVMTPMTRNADPDTVIAEWGAKLLDFPPGQRYEYSNTGYMIAGRIVEKVSGQSLEAFLRQHIWKKLGMTSVVNYDAGRLRPGKDPIGYDRAALGPSRPALHEGSGWGMGAFQWAMTAQDLAKWDISLINRTLLEPASYDQFFTPERLNDGSRSTYALGLQVRAPRAYVAQPAFPFGSTPPPFAGFISRVALSHSGEVSGFVSANTVYPDEKAAVVVLTNAESVSPAVSLASSLGDIVDPPRPDPANPSPTILAATPPPMRDAPPPAPNPYADLDAKVADLLASLQVGQPERSVMTQNLSDYFSPQVVADFKTSLGTLGPAKSVSGVASSTRGGMVYRGYSAVFMQSTVSISVYAWPDGKLEQFLVSP